MKPATFSLPHAARTAFAEWISAAPWDWFVTFTDAGQSHPEAMAKRERYFRAQLNDHLYGKRAWRRLGLGIEAVTGIERQSRGSAHAHSIYRFPDHDAMCRDTVSIAHWQKVAADLGGFAWLELARNQAAVSAYVTKYVLKDGEVLLSPNLNPNNPRQRSNASILYANGGTNA